MKLITEWQEKENMFSKYDDVDSVMVYGNDCIENEKYTIFIPTFRRSELLKVALDSAISQDFVLQYRIIVVDNDNEIDEKTDELMRRYCHKYENITYYRNSKNIGMFGNWNRGFELAKTEYVTMLHDDDLLCENYLSTLDNVLMKNKVGIIGVFSKFLENTDCGLKETQTCHSQNKMKRIISKIAKGKPLSIDIYDNYRSITITPTACSFCKEAMIECGGFNEGYFPIADIIMFNKLTYFYGGSIIPQFLAIRRIGENEMKNVLAGCTEKSAVYHKDLQSKLYKKKAKMWIAEYAAAVNHLIFLCEKYDPQINIEETLKSNGLSLKWNRIPKLFLKGVLGCFWLRLLIKNFVMERKNGKNEENS